MKKISQIAITFMLILPAIIQVSVLNVESMPTINETEEDMLDPAYKKVDFTTKEIVIYPQNIVLIRKEATVGSDNKFYTILEGNVFPGCVRILEDGSTVKDITMKSKYSVYRSTGTDVFSLNMLLKDNRGNIVELITSNAFYRGKVLGVLNGFLFLKDVELSRLFGETIEQRNVSFICLKVNDIENIVLISEPDLPDMSEDETATVDDGLTTRITWEDTGGASRKVTLIYVISGISWKSEYFLDTYTPFADQDEDNARLEHWAVITNNLDIDFVDVHVRLVAGDIKLQGSVDDHNLYKMNAAQGYLNNYNGVESDAVESAAPSSFTMQEFEVYTLPYKITLMKGETKQIQLQTCDVDIIEEFVYDATHLKPSRNIYSTWEDESSGKVQKILKIKNNGKTWPEGTVNVYQDYMLIGQDGIEWTPKGRDAKVTIGVASDIEVKKKITVKRINPMDRYNEDYNYTITIHIHNYKDKAVTVKVFDTFESNALDLESHPVFEEKPGNQMAWGILVQAGADTEIVYTYMTKN